MKPERARVFFYGLYMDTNLLESLGFHPRQVVAARLDDHEIRIGERATLVPARGKISYGLLHDLARDDVTALYARPEVRAYRAQPVVCMLLADSSLHSASCYVLQPHEIGQDTNAEYAAKLAALVSRLGLPRNYAKEILDLAHAAQ